jgi:hypothetical protein
VRQGVSFAAGAAIASSPSELRGVIRGCPPSERPCLFSSIIGPMLLPILPH